MNGGRDVLLMKMLRDQMQGWFDVIRRAVGAQSVAFSIREGGKEFAVVVVYKTKQGETVTHESHFTQQRVFGDSMRGAPLTWRAQRKACDYAKEVMGEILHKRGVI